MVSLAQISVSTVDDSAILLSPNVMKALLTCFRNTKTSFLCLLVETKGDFSPKRANDSCIIWLLALLFPNLLKC